MGFDPITLTLANAYTNRQRLAYSEPGKVLLEHEIVSDEGMDLGLPLIDIVPGRKYTVTIFEGTESFSNEYEAKELHVEGENVHASYLGNLAPIGGEDTGENFLVMSGEMGSEGDCTAVWRVGTASFETISVASPETIHPIDPKYLPGVTIDCGAYGIDLATLVMSGGGTVEVLQTSEMWQKINENADCDLRFSTVIGGERYTFTPVVISKVDGEVVNLGMLLAVVNSGVMVSANIQLTKFTIGDSSEGTFVYATVTQTPIPTTQGGD